MEVKETARGGGKMCSDESKEWHEKEAKREKGKDAAVNGGAALHSIKKTKRKGGRERRINGETQLGIFGMSTDF